MKIEINIKAADEKHLKRLQKRFPGASPQEVLVSALRFASEVLVPEKPFCVVPHGTPGKIGYFPVEVNPPEDPKLTPGHGVLAINPEMWSKKKFTGLKTLSVCKFPSTSKIPSSSKGGFSAGF